MVVCHPFCTRHTQSKQRHPSMQTTKIAIPNIGFCIVFCIIIVALHHLRPRKDILPAALSTLGFLQVLSYLRQVIRPKINTRMYARRRHLIHLAYSLKIKGHLAATKVFRVSGTPKQYTGFTILIPIVTIRVARFICKGRLIVYILTPT